MISEFLYVGIAVHPASASFVSCLTELSHSAAKQTKLEEILYQLNVFFSMLCVWKTKLIPVVG